MIYSIKISGSGEEDEIIKALRDLANSIGAKILNKTSIVGDYEDATLCSEIREND